MANLLDAYGNMIQPEMEEKLKDVLDKNKILGDELSKKISEILDSWDCNDKKRMMILENALYNLWLQSVLMLFRSDPDYMVMVINDEFETLQSKLQEIKKESVQ